MKVLGCDYSFINSNLKAYICQRDTVVVGLLKEGIEWSLQNQYDSPFADMSTESKFPAITGGVKHLTGRTSISLTNTSKVWTGSDFSEQLSLSFISLNGNPKLEVDDALIALRKMASPELNNYDSITPGGRVPGSIAFRVGGKTAPVRLLENGTFIENITVTESTAKTFTGELIMADVTINFIPNRTINGSELS